MEMCESSGTPVRGVRMREVVGTRAGELPQSPGGGKVHVIKGDE
jgi:hypothetical protein